MFRVLKLQLDIPLFRFLTLDWNTVRRVQEWRYLRCLQGALIAQGALCSLQSLHSCLSTSPLGPSGSPLLDHHLCPPGPGQVSPLPCSFPSFSSLC